ncbi:MAG: caspase family protein, partial [Verrucomicrobiota bacterium]|nr:caspase family protein [Verrucomicrobiota bacterium]
QIDSQPPPAERTPNFPFDDRARAIWRIIDDLKTAAPSVRGEGDAEGCERDRSREFEFYRTTVPAPGASAGSRDARRQPLPPELLEDLRPHVINLNLGRFSETGRFQTRPSDVDAIFEEHLPAWAREREGQKLPIVFYAHGGLTSEEDGLLTAAQQVDWWRENGAYPIHFIWETGLFETLGQLLNPNRRRAIDFAAPGDFLLEQLARRVGGVKIWSGMKASAERASDSEGGARYAARKLKEFCEEYGDRVEIHAVGHSAGSIFHAHFAPAALEEGVPGFRSMHFLAPAIRVDTFEQQLLGRIGKGKGVDHLSIFTMARSFEEDDNCVSVYRKSLLYLIYHALEPAPKTPILGLEESIRANGRLKRLFNLDGKGAGGGDAIWSVSRERTGRSASTSRTHGGFNNDAPTMQSVAQRILDREVTAFTGAEERVVSLLDSLEVEAPELARLLQPGEITFTQSAGAFAGPAPAFVPAPQIPERPPMIATAGRRRALCVGIDRYPTAPLGGCVNDARQWRETFRKLGFGEPALLVDGEATRSAILGHLTELVRTSRPGDVVAFQFSGHGTQLADRDKDEAGGDTPGLDEALCPIDFDRGHFVIDDDLATVFDGIPAGVSVTAFIDCCHSGTITRLAIGAPPADGAAGSVRARFITATPAMEEAHAAFRDSLRGARALSRRGAYDQAREILFSACRSREVALESDGQGHFTTRATKLLSAGIHALTSAEFEARVRRAFGPNPAQNPELHCAPALRDLLLLSPVLPAAGALAGAAPVPAGAREERGNGNGHDRPGTREEVARILEEAVRAVRS